MDVVLFAWLWLFVLSMIPGSIVGGLIAKKARGVPAIVGVSVAAAVSLSLVISLVLVTNEPLTLDIYVRNIGLFGPPLLAAILFSVYLARRSSADPSRSAKNE